MSDFSLLLIPADPTYRPTAVVAERARALLESLLPPAASVEARYEDQVTFFDAGGNWEGVACPACGADAEDWWGEAMDQSAEQAFSDLACTAACCGARVSLNALNYGWPVGFGRFALEAVNPGNVDLADHGDALRQALGCEIREIRRHA